MESGPLSDPSFAEFAKDVVLYLNVTSHIEGDKDQDLLQHYGGRGFPTLLWLDQNGDKQMEQDERTVDGFKAVARSLSSFAALAKNEKRSAAEEFEFLCVRIALGKVDAKTATDEAGKLSPDKDQKARLDQLIVKLEIKEAMAKIESKEDAVAAGKGFAAMVAAGRIPADVGIPTAQFWMVTAEFAESSKDAALFERCVDGVKAALENKDQYKRVFDGLQQRLDKLKQ